MLYFHEIKHSWMFYFHEIKHPWMFYFHVSSILNFYKNFNHASSMIAHKWPSWTKLEGYEIMFRPIFFYFLLARWAKINKNNINIGRNVDN